MPRDEVRRISPLHNIKEVRVAIETNFGVIWCQLHVDGAPRTVANFVGLAEGTTSYWDSDGFEVNGVPYYDGLTFHRVIPGFMIQGGCNRGNGTGGPGYVFADEFNRRLQHNKKGVLSMANAGPDTNGGQFFITLAPQLGLDMRHTVFGEVLHGIEVVDAICALPRDHDDKPRQEAVIERVTVEKVPR